MARINLLLQLQQQKLLAENKERAGHNRSAKEDRNRTTKTADKASAPPATTATAQAKQADDARKKRELSGGSLDLHKRRRPAATGNNKKFGVFGLSYPDPFEPQPRINVSQAWTATASRWIEYQNIGPFFYDYWLQDYQQQRTNSYTVIPSQRWAPSFTKETQNHRDYINSPAHVLSNTTFKFDWTFFQSNVRLSATEDVPITAQILATLPQLPEPVNTWFTNHPRFSLNHLPKIAASDGRYIWYSTVYALSRPSYNFYYTFTNLISAEGPMQSNGDQNRFYDTQNGGEYVREIVARRTQNSYPLSLAPASDTTSGYNLDDYRNDNYKRYGDWDFLIRPLNNTTPNVYSQVQAYALTWRYDTQNPQSPPNFSEHNLGYTGDGTAAGLHNFASMYLGLLDASHPAKEEWTKMLALKTQNESFATLADRYFDPTYGSGLYSLVPGLVYYKDTGLAIYTGKLKRGGAYPNFPRVYTKTLTLNLSYSSASYRMPYPSSTPGIYFNRFLTTHEDMIADGWKEQPDAPVGQYGSPLPYYFTHRST